MQRSFVLVFTQVASKIAAISDTLVKLGYPPVSMMLYMMQMWSGRDRSHTRGGPQSEAYIAHTAGTPDGTPVIPVALMTPKDTTDYLKQQTNVDHSVSLANIRYGKCRRLRAT